MAFASSAIVGTPCILGVVNCFMASTTTPLGGYDIAARGELGNSTPYRILQKLKIEGWLEETTGASTRKTLYRLTARGLECGRALKVLFASA